MRYDENGGSLHIQDTEDASALQLDPADKVMPDALKPLRADAQRNRDALVAAAAEAFAECSVEASLEGIAKRAGVGVGTLYRHFPAREALIAAVYQRELESVAQAADELLASERDAMRALRAWSERFLDYAAAKRGLGDGLRAIIDCKPELRGSALPKLEAAITTLLEHGTADGSIRADALPEDVLRAMTAIFHIPHVDGWIDQARRILNLLLDGLEPR
jgi:AcrR family transcriptional regulator